MLKRRKKPTEHRQGNLINLIDAVQRLTTIRHEKGYWLFDTKDRFDEGHINPKYAKEIDDIVQELRLFDITEIGNLYLTSSGRIVLDKGWGEYFNKADTAIFTLGELTAGIPLNKFIDKIQKKGQHEYL